jgi:hypothetical protein
VPILALTELGKKDASWLDLPRICVANTRYQCLRLAFVDLSRYGNLNLTIDSNLQFFAQQVLADTVAELNADWASAIVIEVETGSHSGSC